MSQATDNRHRWWHRHWRDHAGNTQGLQQAGLELIVMAVPAGPRDAIEALQSEVDELICLAMPAPSPALASITPISSRPVMMK